ncbi:MAG: hypothetical protein U5R30_12420 [Deltaproteobacteria bacterium]|nr:hypothetical protein [Deltaproteobacteria bacterium]
MDTLLPASGTNYVFDDNLQVKRHGCCRATSLRVGADPVRAI